LLIKKALTGMGKRLFCFVPIALPPFSRLA
jgi:hypothetical protein